MDLKWILGGGIVGYFLWNQYQSSQAAAQLATPASSAAAAAAANAANIAAASGSVAASAAAASVFSAIGGLPATAPAFSAFPAPAAGSTSSSLVWSTAQSAWVVPPVTPAGTFAQIPAVAATATSAAVPASVVYSDYPLVATLSGTGTVISPNIPPALPAVTSLPSSVPAASAFPPPVGGVSYLIWSTASNGWTQGPVTPIGTFAQISDVNAGIPTLDTVYSDYPVVAVLSASGVSIMPNSPVESSAAAPIIATALPSIAVSPGNIIPIVSAPVAVAGPTVGGPTLVNAAPAGSAVQPLASSLGPTISPTIIGLSGMGGFSMSNGEFLPDPDTRYGLGAIPSGYPTSVAAAYGRPATPAEIHNQYLKIAANSHHAVKDSNSYI
jgi:hypothetical protein